MRRVGPGQITAFLFVVDLLPNVDEEFGDSGGVDLGIQQEFPRRFIGLAFQCGRMLL